MSSLTEELISEASAGRALRGLAIVICLKNQTDVGKQLLLCPPTSSHVRVMSSDQQTFSVAYCFSRAEESASFSKCVMDKGWSIATRIHADAFLWGASADASFDMKNQDHQVSDEKLTKKVSQACITQCMYTPITSFQIPRAKMILSEAALQRALAIQNVLDADNFLRAFNPFVSESLYHLGGVFFRESTVKCSEETTLYGLLSQTQQEMKGSAKVKVENKISGVEVEASGEKKEDTENSSEKTSAIKIEESIERTIILGASTARNSDEFLEKLKDDPHSRAIIDKAVDGRDTLVGVWELLKQHSQLTDNPPAGELDNIAVKLKIAAKILCERWVYLASNHSDLPPPSSWEAECYQRLIDQSKLFLANLSSDPALVAGSMQKIDATLPPLPDLGPDEASLTQLVQNLNQVLLMGEDKVSDISQTASQHVNFFVREGKSAEYYEKALTVLHHYGFAVHGGNWECQLDHVQLKSMIEELREIENATAEGAPEKIPTSAWGPDLIMAPSDIHECYQFKYFGDVVVDRNLSECPELLHDGVVNKLDQIFQQAAASRLIDCLRHRLNPLTHLLQTGASYPSSSLEVNDPRYSWADEDDEVEGPLVQVHAISPLELLIQIIQGSDLSAQIAICDLLLSQRSAVPFILPLVNDNSSSQLAAATTAAKTDVTVRLAHYIKALSFVKVNLGKEQKLCIADDLSLPRVVFISNKSVLDSHAAIIASRVLNCDFMSQHFREDMSVQFSDAAGAGSTVMEVGVGFIAAPPRSAQAGQAEYLACLSIHITGAYHPVMSFVDDIADVVVLELKQGNPDQQNPPHTPCVVLRWQETDGKPRRDTKKRLIWGTETSLVAGIGEFLYSQLHKIGQSKVTTSMSEVCGRHFHLGHGHELITGLEEPLQGMFDQCDFSDMRKRLTLQRSLVTEAEAFFECFQLQDDPARKHAKERVCKQERDRRLRLAKDVISFPMMKLFHQLLKLDAAPSVRRFGIMWLGRALSQKMYKVLEDASKKVDKLYKAFNENRKDAQAKQQYLQAKLDYVGKSVGLDNLWRELCHIYEADPTNQHQLVRQAAQHLLDGFPLEILDGDAGMYCKLWVQSVLVQLESMTKKQGTGRSARIFVLSVMGLQSSGKSTMLNVMFGTKLQTSAGRCTRGVYMQLVPSERAEYDFVLLLDTEGLRSPEYFGLEASIVRDNRLATFGLLPADASMFMVCNEDDAGLKEVLPMVLLAFKGSAIADKCGQRIRAKVVFVYRSVNTNDKKNLKKNMEKLHEYLIEASEEVARMGGVLSSAVPKQALEAGQADGREGSLNETLLTDFRVDEDEKKSDVKFVGNLTKGNNPPTDTPEWAYGESVVELRQYLHMRVVNDVSGWKASSFAEWGERLMLVWDCICSADFELSFLSKMEYASYLELQASLQPPREEVHKKYMEVFNSMERRMRDAAVNKDESITNLYSVLEADVKVVVEKQKVEVEKIINTKKGYAKWRAQELDNWKRFCAITEDWYKKRILDLESGVLRFDRVVAEYQQQCKAIIVDKIESGEWGSKQSLDMWRQKFEEMFKRILDDAETKHPPIAKDVHRRVMDRYKEANLARVIDMYKDQKGTHNSFWTKMSQGLKKVVGSWGSTDDTRPSYSYELEMILDRQLRDAKQYSEIIVDNVINSTKQILESVVPKLSREQQGGAHVWVKDTLTDRMRVIQSAWDKDHNVAEKLKSQKIKDQLYHYFANLSNGLEATARLVKELQGCLEDELEETHSAAVVGYVVLKIETEKLVRDWWMMRAVLDYHLLTLMEARNTGKLLGFVTNAPLHFGKMMDALVGQAITRELVQRQWDDLLKKVQNCVKGEASIKNPSVEAFLAALRIKLADTVNSKLADTVTSSIHVSSYTGRDLDSDFYDKKLPELCESLQRKAMPDFKKMRYAIIEGVRQEMESLLDENCRPRCEASCPRCGSTCMLAKGHIAARHDTIHQPAGLRGNVWHGTSNLVERSCLQMLQTGCSFYLDDGTTTIPYSDFEKHFTTWKNPSSNESIAVQVRECIFFNYPKEVADWFKCSPPAQMPDDYNHGAAGLRASLRNKLRPKFKDEQDWTHFTQMLTSL